jgi:hypothetical protein
MVRIIRPSRRRSELILAYRSMVWPHFDFKLITNARIGRENRSWGTETGFMN